MRYAKSYLRRKLILHRKKKYSKSREFNFNLIFKLIKKEVCKSKITIAGYYPSNYEVNILKFMEEATKKKIKIALPFIKSSTNMCFKLWGFKEPLYINNFGILEPNSLRKDIIPDVILVPLVAFDNNLNRIGYGKGYYDRILKKIKKINKNTISLGIAYSFQRIGNVPVNKHDFKLDYIFTERGIISSK